MNRFRKKLVLTAQIKAKVHYELVDIVYKQIIHMLWAEAFAGALMLFIFWWHDNRVLVSAWAVSMIVLTGLPRIYIAKKYAHASKENKRNKIWVNVLMALLALAALGWGFAGTVLLPTSYALDEAVTLFLLVGIAAAANPFYSPLKQLYNVFVIPTLGFPALLMFMHVSHYSIFVGTALLAFSMLMLITAIISSELINHALRLRFQNLELSKDLLKSNIRLENIASHDMLTNLANRPFFYEKLDKTILDAEQHNKSFALLFLDLDKFKVINDSMGHDTGDQLLKDVAERLKQNIRPTDMACRLGGDEFILLLSDISNPRLAAIIAQRVCQALALPFSIKSNEIFITSSIGISVYPADGTDKKTLIKKADMAMYDTKNHRKGSYNFFNATINDNIGHD